MNIYSPLVPESKDVTLLQIISVNSLIQSWKKEFEIDISDELEGITEIYLYRCNQTHLNFFLPSNIVGSSQLYENLEKFNWYYIPRKWEHDVAFEDLKGYKRILEVGCGKGAFVKRLRNSKFEAEGIEFNSKAVEHAQTENIPVISSSLEEVLNSQPEQFDAVCAFQVLEHVSDPYKFISNLVSLARIGGKIIFAVPNADSFLKHQFNLLDMPPHHMTQWQISTFEFLEKIFPLKIVGFSVEPLSIIHANGYFLSYCEAWIERFPVSKIFLNRYTLPVLIKSFRVAVRMGAGRLLIGQSLYVCFEKV